MVLYYSLTISCVFVTAYRSTSTVLLNNKHYTNTLGFSIKIALRSVYKIRVKGIIVRPYSNMLSQQLKHTMGEII